ncbi:hypothetical protein AAGW05_14810 [Arthrobacter sp. LAPM80]|uniref:hypothetical protein n=1 Tax=Arthrobacter sp. LAPM80 TaxID=3141788 RepID=UPI00398A5FDB
MQSDPGAGTPHTGGNDDEVWRDLVARLEEVQDGFMDAPENVTDGPAEAAPSPVKPAPPTEAKGVVDFDPLGVWQQQSEPAPREPAAHERRNADDAGPSGPRDYDVEHEDDEFVPEELPSLRGSEPAIVMSWVGAAGGPLFLVLSAIFWRQIPMILVIGVIVAFLAGTGYLLYRLPNHRDHDSGDGAVV